MDDSQQPPETIARKDGESSPPVTESPEASETPETSDASEVPETLEAAEADSDAPSSNLAQIYDSGQPTSPPKDPNGGSTDDTDDGKPESLGDTKSYKVGVFWRVNFSRPAQVAAGTPEIGYRPRSNTTEEFRLTNIPPGLLLSDARARIAGLGISGGVSRPGVVVYETKILPTIDQRQRLAVELSGNSVSRTALIVDFDNTSNATANSRLFERIRDLMIRRYGSPDSAFSLGQMTSSLAADVNRGTFIRTTEWTTRAGKIRLGIPRRRDGQVRIEVQISQSFAPPRDTLWSIEEAR